MHIKEYNIRVWDQHFSVSLRIICRLMTDARVCFSPTPALSITLSFITIEKSIEKKNVNFFIDKHGTH